MSFGASNSINSYLGGSATHSDAVTPNNTGDFAINFDFALNVSPNDNAGAFSDTVTLTFDNGLIINSIILNFNLKNSKLQCFRFAYLF
ncbi:MAG: hypothetical protein KatS3mg068_0432 [Candidatus Sericytochromatia bacterium]|nr:MAG: hypothetical protein KatS3mg068_0432 [Candidatus Sericytochromatia bacterium]